ncbi:unnamed protein product [Clonostachys byssicola]|uniref:Major facilitator superfamily (MFS) profile domain-containing protein n=1 Tax=Clonostachys byssicola TaxID=160290 RepID=A0A9N9YDL8_9HYPO|nr:unnamed protein product [Clonostachys byssicola]
MAPQRQTPQRPQDDPSLDQDKYKEGGNDMDKDGDLIRSMSITEGQVTCVPDPASPHGSFLEAARAWPYAIVWSIVFSNTLILVAYCPAWIAQLYALPAFTTRFGYEYQGQYVIDAKWQAALAAASMGGQFIGAPAIAILMDKYGRKPAFMGCLVVIASFTFIQIFSTTLPVLLTGTILVGTALGCFGVLSLTYAMEVAPLHLRGVLGGVYSIGIVIGPLLSVVIAQGAVHMSSVWGYRMGFAVQWAWPLFLLPSVAFAPESPVWLIRQGRAADAEAALRRLAVWDLDVLPDLERIVALDLHEQALEASSSYLDIFKGTNLRRTLISAVSYASIATTGNTLTNSGAYFMLWQEGADQERYVVVGVDANTGFYWSLACSLGAFLGSLPSLWILAKYRRRWIYFWAQLSGAVCLLAIGFIQINPQYYETYNSVFTQGAFMVIWNLIYGAAIGPLSTVIMGEVPSNALRAKTVAFATMTQVALMVVGLTINPYFLDPEHGHLQGYVGFIAGGSELLWTVWSFFCLPETSLSVERLDELFNNKVSARHFVE